MVSFGNAEEDFVEEVEYEYDVVCEEDASIGDEDFLASIQSSIRKEFDARKAKGNREESAFENINNANEVVEIEILGEEQEDEVTEEILEYSNLSIGIDEEIVENPDTVEEQYEYDEQVIEKWFQAESIPDDLEAACRQLIPIVYKGEDHVDPEKMMRRTPLPELYKYLKQHYDYKKDVKNEICDEVQEKRTEPMEQSSLQSLFQQRADADFAKEKERSPPEGSATIGVDSGKGTCNPKSNKPLSSMEGVEYEGMETQQAEIIDQWGEAHDGVPEDLEMACKTLIQAVYKNKEVDAEILMARIPLLDLYRQLKQHCMNLKDLEQDNFEEFIKRRNDDEPIRSDITGVEPAPGHGKQVSPTKESESQYEGTLEDSVTEFISTLPDDSVHGEVIEESLRDESHGDIEFGEDVLGRSKGDFTSSIKNHLGESMCSYFEEVVEMGMSGRSFLEEEIIEDETENTDDGAIDEVVFVYEDVIVGCERRGSL